MTQSPVHIQGKDKGHIMLYALSTCSHCRRVKELLNELGVSYDYIFVDHLPRVEMDEIIKEIEKFNPRCSFPTLVINGSKVIIGSREDEIREALA